MPKWRDAAQGVTPEETDKRILALGLDHQLVTRLTSLVAVDKTPSRPDGARLSRADLPLNLPAGWDFDKVFGESRAHRPRKDDRAEPNRRRRTRPAAAGRRIAGDLQPAIAWKAEIPGRAQPAGGAGSDGRRLAGAAGA